MNHVSGKIVLSTVLGLGLIAGASSEAAAAVDAQDCLQSYYMKSYAKALPLCLVAAKAGHGQAQFVLGMMYAEGNGTSRSYQDASRWLEAASQQGHLAARHKIQNLENERSDAARRNMTSSFWLHHKPLAVKNQKEEAITAEVTAEEAELTKQATVKKQPLQIETFAEPESIPSTTQYRPLEPAIAKSAARLMNIQPLDVEPEVIQPADIKTVETVPEQSMPVQKSSGDEPIKEDFSKSWPQYEGLNSSETSEIAEIMARDMAESDK